MKSSGKTTRRQNNILHNKNSRSRLRTIHWNQRTLPHNNTIPIVTMGKRMQKGGRKSPPKSWTEKLYGWEIYPKKKERKKEGKFTEKKITN